MEKFLRKQKSQIENIIKYKIINVYFLYTSGVPKTDQWKFHREKTNDRE